MASWKDNGRESKRFRSPNRIQQRVLKKERSHVDAEGVGKMRKKVGLEKRRRRNPSPTVKEEVGEKSVEEAPATNKGEPAFRFCKQAGLKMEAVPMPKTRVKAEEVKASDLKTEAASVVKPKGANGGGTQACKRAQIGRKGRTKRVFEG